MGNQIELYKQQAEEGIQAIHNMLIENGGDLQENLDKMPLRHSFTDGIYVRELTIPEGTMLVGKIHKHRHHNMLLKGDIIVATSEGNVEMLQAPLMIVSEPGTQRVGYAVTECVWSCIHKNEDNIEDLDKLEQINGVSSKQEYLEYKKEQDKLISKT